MELEAERGGLTGPKSHAGPWWVLVPGTTLGAGNPGVNRADPALPSGSSHLVWEMDK